MADLPDVTRALDNSMKVYKKGLSPMPSPVPTPQGWWRRLLLQEDLNFLLTNRIPRMALTHFMGWYSSLRSPLLTRLSIWVWRRFTDLDLSDAQATRFESLHACFTRALKPGSRPFDPTPDVLCSPCDAIVGAAGTIDGDVLLQAKGSPYRLHELLGSHAPVGELEGGTYVTLRLTSSMYHRFHAPDDARLEHVTYISGDTWNVNPIALARIERLFCRNERAVLRFRRPDGSPMLLVPVAAVLVASLRLHALDLRLHLRYQGPNEIACAVPVHRGDELGWFEHGSTIIVLVPPGHELREDLQAGTPIRCGEALLVRRSIPH